MNTPHQIEVESVESIAERIQERAEESPIGTTRAQFLKMILNDPAILPHIHAYAELQSEIRELRMSRVLRQDQREAEISDLQRANEELKSKLRTAVDDDLKYLLRGVFEVCEYMENLEGNNDFSRGRTFATKKIRNAIDNWFQDEFCGRQCMGEPVRAPNTKGINDEQ